MTKTFMPTGGNMTMITPNRIGARSSEGDSLSRTLAAIRQKGNHSAAAE